MKKFREISEAIKDKYDIGEYDQEGDMAKSDLRSIIANSKRVHDMLKDDDNLPEWVQSKITKAEDYMSTVANYLESEMNEEVGASKKQETTFHKKLDTLVHKTFGKRKEEMKEAKETGFEKTFRKNTGETYDQYANRRAKEEDERQEKMKKQKEDYIKQGIIKAESCELSEGRPSQRHPLEGHEYHRKSDAELVGIAKDAHKAAEAMKSHNTTAENKYRDQANDSATVRYFRKKSGMPDWYKKKYGHMKEDVEIDEAIRHEIAGAVGQFIGNKIDPVHGDIMRMHGKEAYRQAAYHIRKTVNDVKDAVSSLHDRLHKQLRTGGLTTEDVELDEARYPGFRPGLGLGKRGAPSQRDNYKDFNDGRPLGFTPIKDKKPEEPKKMKEEVELDEEMSHSELADKHHKRFQKHYNAAIRLKDDGREDRSNKHLNVAMKHAEIRDKHIKSAKSMKKEEVELDEVSADVAKRVAQARDRSAVANKLTSTQSRRLKMGDKGGDPDMNAAKALKSAMKRGAKNVYGEEVELLDEKNEPTNPELWSRAKSLAKSKFDVYPSAYANGWASKWYKSKGGGWKSVSEETELDEGYFKNQEIERQETERLAKRNELPFTPDKPKKKSVVVGKKPEGYSRVRQLARQAMQKYTTPVKEEKDMSKKAKVVKDIMKKSPDDKFQANPELSNSVTRNL